MRNNMAAIAVLIALLSMSFAVRIDRRDATLGLDSDAVNADNSVVDRDTVDADVVMKEATLSDSQLVLAASADTTAEVDAQASWRYISTSMGFHNEAGRGRWSISSRSISQSSNAGSPRGGMAWMKGTMAFVKNGLNWQDYRIKGVIRSGDNDVIGVMFRYRDPSNYYLLSWGGGDVDRELRLMRKSGSGPRNQLWHRRVAYQRYRSYEWEIRVVGSEIKFLLDRSLMFTVRDSRNPRGTIGFWSCVNTQSSWSYWRYQIDTSRAELAKLQKTVSVLAAASSTLGKTLASRRSEANAAKAAASQAVAQAKGAATAETTLKTDLTKLMTEEKTLLSQLKLAEEVARKLKAQVDASVASERSERDSLQKEVTRLDASTGPLSEKVVSTAKLIVQERSEAGRLTDQLVTVLAMIKTSKSKLGAEKAAVTSREGILSRQAQAAADVHGVVLARLTALKDKVTSATDGIAEVKREDAKMQSEMQVAQRQMDDSKTTLKQYYDEAEGLRTEMSSSRKTASTEAHANHKTLEDMESQSGALKGTIAQLSGEYERAQDHEAEARHALEALEKEEEESKKTMAAERRSKQQTLNDLEAQVAVLRHLVQDTQQELLERKAKLDKILGLVQDSTTDRVQTMKEVSAMEERRTHVVNQVHGLQRVAHGLIDDVSEEKAAKNKLMAEVKRKEQSVKALTTKTLEQPKQAVVHTLVPSKTAQAPSSKTSTSTLAVGNTQAAASVEHPALGEMQTLQRSIGDSARHGDVLKQREEEKLEAAAKLLLTPPSLSGRPAGDVSASKAAAGAAPPGLGSATPPTSVTTTVQTVDASSLPPTQQPQVQQ